VLLLALGSCRAIAGLHDVRYLSADAACVPPVLPTAGNGRVRVVNAGTQGGAVDFCLRAGGTSDWGTPVLSAGPPSCDTGLAYTQATVPFAVPAGLVDVEAIPAGSKCAGTATSQALGVSVDDITAGGRVLTLVRFGGGVAENIVALPEEPPPSPSDSPSRYAMRIVNALSSGESINVGLSASPSLPTTVPEFLLPVPIAPGGVEPPADVVPMFRSFDAEGYGVPFTTVVDFGFVLQEQHNAIFTIQTAGVADVQTLFAIGDSADPAHSIRGLLCEDAGAAVQDGGAASATALLASCTLSSLPSIAVDTFNTSLYGSQAPFEVQRRTPVYDAIAARTTDLMCVIETSLDVDNIVAHAKNNFPYSYFVRTTLDTVPTDPTDANGNIPPPPSGPPCAGIDPGILQAAYDCAAKNCSSSGDMSGTIATTNCLSGACPAQFLPLYYQGPQKDACFDCIIDYALSQPLSAGLQACTTDPREPFEQNGMNATLMLSRYPLSNTQAFILPGTGYRRVFLYAQVALEDQTVDFFCGQLISPLIDGQLPYVGNYGVDIPNQENGWEDEQYLQAKKVIPWIKATASHPAIIAGDWHSTLKVTAAAPDGGTITVLDDQSPKVISAFDKDYGGAFLRAEPSDYKPICEYCPAPKNVYNTGSNIHPEDFTPTFLYGFPPTATTTDDIQWGTDNVVPLTPYPYQPAPAPVGPVSVYFGRLVRVLRPPTH
jgi:hypothetical protein